MKSKKVNMTIEETQAKLEHAQMLIREAQRDILEVLTNDVEHRELKDGFIIKLTECLPQLRRIENDLK